MNVVQAAGETAEKVPTLGQQGIELLTRRNVCRMESIESDYEAFTLSALRDV